VSYLDLDGFESLTTMPGEFVEAIELASPGWIEGQLAYWTRWMDSRLSKRYAAPFATPYPDAVQGWLARIVTVRCFLKRGIDPNDAQFLEYKSDAEMATEEIKEAANSDTGLFDLPLRADTTVTGISKGGPYVYSESSPYVWTDEQVRVGRVEDRNRRGSGV
jgi:hypothetical protein